jgi:hypothetical protein
MGRASGRVGGAGGAGVGRAGGCARKGGCGGSDPCLSDDWAAVGVLGRGLEGGKAGCGMWRVRMPQSHLLDYPPTCWGRVPRHRVVG